MRVKKNKYFSLVVRHTQKDLLLYLVDLKLGVNLRIILINLVIVKLFGVCPIFFPPLRRKGFSRKYLCSCMIIILDLQFC